MTTSTNGRDTLAVYYDAIIPPGESGILHLAVGLNGYFTAAGQYSFKPDKQHPDALWKPRVFPYPDERGEAFDWILDMAQQGDVYGCPNLLTGRRRTALTAKVCQLVHGDIDHSFDRYEVEEQLGGIVVASGSDGHGQILIPLSAAVTEEQRMALCVAIRARYDGDDKIADNDVLRPPMTKNWKARARGDGEPTDVWLMTDPPPARRIKPYDLGRKLNIELANVVPTAPQKAAEALQTAEPVDLDDYPLVKMAFDTRADPPDRSKDTVRIVGACIDAGLSIGQTRTVLDDRPDLADRLNGRNDDDVARVWAKLTAERAAEVAEFKNGEWLLEWPGAGNQLGMAYRLAKAYPNQLLYVHGLGWHYWDATRWVRDDIGKANRGVYALFKWARSVTKEDDADDDKTAKNKAALRATVTKCETSNGVDSILRLAQRLPAIAATADDMDRDPFMLNTLDGIVDLRNGECAPHDPKARHTKQTGVGYDPAAEAPRWKAFLQTTFGGNDELTDYVQRFLGYAAIGEVSRHILPFLHGSGDNGKTVLLEVVSAILGSYAITAPANFLAARRNDKHETEIARLCGARLVVCSEVNRDSKFDEQRVKTLTGGDGLTGRFMRRDFFDFKPSHTLILVGNNQPEVSAGGKSFWRRLRLIPFLHEVAPAERNENLTRELIEEEGPAILAWIVAGAQAFIAKGLDDPAVVMTATTEYAESEDHVQLFIDDCCDTRPEDERVEYAEVYKRYAAWCKDNGIDKLASGVLGRELSGKGFGRARTNSKRYVTGIWVNDPPTVPKTAKAFFDWTDKYES